MCTPFITYLQNSLQRTDKLARVAKHANLPAWNLKIAHNTATIQLCYCSFVFFFIITPPSSPRQRIAVSVPVSLSADISRQQVFKLNEVFCPLRYSKLWLPEAVARSFSDTVYLLPVLTMKPEADNLRVKLTHVGFRAHVKIASRIVNMICVHNWTGKGKACKVSSQCVLVTHQEHHWTVAKFYVYDYIVKPLISEKGQIWLAKLLWRCIVFNVSFQEWMRP